MPTTDEGIQQQERGMKQRFGEIDRQASELNVEIQEPAKTVKTAA